MTEKKTRSRCSYPAEVRSEAKAMVGGLITISVTLPNGDRDEMQMAANAAECKFARWAAALLAREDARPVPDLEQFVREHLEAKKT